LSSPAVSTASRVDFLTGVFDLLVHLDKHLLALAQDYGGWIYLLLFLIIFSETGLVITPFLPGDSLLFVAGTLAGAGAMNAHVLVAVLTVAAVIGNSVNYAAGRWIGSRVFRDQDSWLFNKAYLERTHRYFERFGGRTIIITRFVPIIRTYAPFVAGIGAMDYRRFLLFNVTGALLWVALITYAGYLFGNVALVKNNLTLVIFAIILVSTSPAIIEFLRHRLKRA
jgi:membrane-associated protein